MTDLSIKEIAKIFMFEYGISKSEFSRRIGVSSGAMYALEKNDEPISNYMLDKVKIAFRQDCVSPEKMAEYEKHRYITENLNTYRMERNRKLQDATQWQIGFELGVSKHVYAGIERGDITPKNWPLCNEIMQILGDDIFIDKHNKKPPKKVPIIGLVKVNNKWRCNSGIKLEKR